jgi:hypothetical protein
MSSTLGIASLVPLQLILLLSGGGLMGTPPGERDAAYLNCAPQKSLVYYEWSPSVPGKPGAPGVDGFIADPEIQEFKAKINTLMTQLTEKVIARSPESTKSTLKDLPDLSKLLLGKSGCFYLHYVFPDNFDENSNPLAAMVGVNGTIILNAERDANRVEEILCKLLGLIPDVETAPTKLDHFRIPIKEAPVHITVHRHQSYIILGWGKSTIQRAIDGLSGNVKGLGDSEKFQKAMNSIKMERTAAVSWLDSQGALETVAKILGPQGAMIQGVAAMTGLSGVDSIASVTGVMENQIRTRSLLITDGKTEGVLSLASGKNMLVSDLLHIPIDVDVLVTVSLNLPKVYETIKNLMGTISQRNAAEFEEGIAQMEEGLGIKLEEDVFAAFGDIWTLYSSPSLGGVFITSPMMTLKVKDYEKAKVVYDRLMGFLDKILPKSHGSMQDLGLESFEFMGQKLHVINLPDDDIPFAPTFCLTQKQLYISLHPQTIKAQFRLIKKNVPSFVQRLSKEIPVPKGDVISFSYLNTKKLGAYLYAAAPYIARLVAMKMKREGIDINIIDLPSAQAILPYLANSWFAVARVENGILFESQSPLPIAGGASLMFNLPMIMGMGGGRSRARFDNVTEELEASEFPSDDVPAEPIIPEPKKASPIKLKPSKKKAGSVLEKAGAN